eukprot:gene25413-31871_t
MAPSFSPTESPSSAPTTFENGWILYNTYLNQSSCSNGTISKAVGFPTDKCLVIYGVNNEPTGSAIHTCTSDSTTSLHFNTSTTCDPLFTSHSTVHPLVCNSSAIWGSSGVECVSVLPQQFSDGSHIVRNTYSSPTSCDLFFQSSLEVVSMNTCFLSQPKYTTLDTICSSDSADNDDTLSPYINDDDQIKTLKQSSVWTNGRTPYTESPTIAPGSPSKSPVYLTQALIEFRVNQTLTGISASQFLSPSDTPTATLNNQTFAFSAADCMEGLVPSDVWIQSVVDVDVVMADSTLTTSAGVTSSRQDIVSKVNSELVIFYTWPDYHSPQQAFDSVSAQLTQAVADGQFSFNLHYYSALFGSTDLLTVNSSSVSVSDDFTIVTQSANDDSSSSDTPPGLVAGLTVSFIVVGACVLFLIRRSCLQNQHGELSEPLQSPTVIDSSSGGGAFYEPPTSTIAVYVGSRVETANAVEMRDSE